MVGWKFLSFFPLPDALFWVSSMALPLVPVLVIIAFSFL